MQVEQASKILQRIRSNYHQLQALTKKVKATKIDLYQDTYLYCETRSTRDGVSIAESVKILAKEIGGTAAYWRRCYNYGSWIRDFGTRTKMPSSEMRPSSVSWMAKVCPKVEKIKPQHLPQITEALNKKNNPSVVRRLLTQLGYQSPVKGVIAKWRREEIRKAKRRWADWRPELERMLSEIRCITDKPDIAIDLVLLVDNQVVLEVSTEPSAEKETA